MKKILYIFMMISLASSLCCCQEEVSEKRVEQPSDHINQMIQTFHQQLHPSHRSTEVNVKVTNVSTVTYRVAEGTRSETISSTDSFDIHTVSLEINGIRGYAILSDTPGIETMFYYTEEGSINDTVTIAPLKELVDCIPSMAEDILLGNIIDTRASAADCPNIDPLVKFTWHQLKPFNNYSTYCTCETCSQLKWGNHRPIGCVAIALGQAIATVKKFTGTFYGNRDIDFDSLPTFGNEFSSYDQNPKFLQVAHFLQEIALNCQMQFGCEASGTSPEAALNYLKDLGYNAALQDGGLNELLFVRNLTLGIPHICCGSNGSSGHAWILDGYRNNTSGKHYHINWGWGRETSNGWSLGYYFGYHSGSNGDEWKEYGKNHRQLYLEISL